MSKSFNQYKVTSLAVLFASVLLSVIRVAVLTNSVEISDAYAEPHYLISVNASTVSFAVAFVAVAILTVLFVVLRFKNPFSVFEAIRPGYTVDLSVYPPSVLFTTALNGFMLFSSGLYYIYLFFSERAFSVGFVILAILMVCSSIGFVYSAFIAKGKVVPGASVWFKVVPIFMGIYWLMYEFIAQNRYQVNSSAAIHIVGLVILMMFFTQDALNAADKLKQKSYYITAALLVLFLFVDAVPNLLLTCFWMFKLDDFVLLYAVELVLALYAFSKVFTALPVRDSAAPDQ